MKRRDKKPAPPPSESPLSKPWFHAALGCLLALTVFLSGEQAERSGVFHLPCILWLLAVLTSIVKRNRLHVSRLDLFVYAFFGLAATSIFWNLLPGRGGGPRPGLNMLSVWLSLAAAWFLFRQILHGPKIVGAALTLIAALALTQASIGLYQQFVDIPAMLRQFEADPAGTVAQVDPSIRPGTPDWDRLVSRLKTAGPMGTYPMTNTLGGFLGTWFVFLLGWTGYRILSKSETKSFSLQNTVLGAVIAVVLICFVLTKCRSAYVAVASGIMLLLAGFFRLRFEKPSGKRLLIPILAVVVLLGGVGVFAKGKSVLAGAKRSLGFRLEYWEASLGMIRDDPLLGCGSGNFKQTYTKYKLPGSSEEIADPHNFVVEIAAVNGIPALFVFAVPLAFLVFRGLFSKPVEPPETEDEAPPGADTWLYGGGLAGCLLAFVFSFNGEAPMDLTSPVFATCSFVVVGFTLREKHAIPSPLLAVTLLVLMVHLLAAGGISVTNTAVCLWLLAALLANREPAFRHQIIMESRFRKGLVLAVPLVSTLFVYFYSLEPVRNARTLSIRADAETRAERHPGFRPGVLADREAATWADPYSAICREELATERFRRWLAAPGDTERKAATLRDQDEAVRLLPRSAGLRYVFAERLTHMYDKTGDAELRHRALELYRQAIERYPNHAKFRAPYALLLNRTDDPEQRREARHQRDEAIRLDGMMPHADQKLPENIRQKLFDAEIWPAGK